MRFIEDTFSLKINNTSEIFSLIAKNQSQSDAVNVCIRVDGRMRKDGEDFILNYKKQNDSVRSKKSTTVEEVTSVELNYTTDYTMTAIVNNSWIRLVFQNKEMKNAIAYKKVCGDKGWRIPCVQRNSIPIEKLIRVLCKDQYLTESCYKKSHFAALVKRSPFTELALEELNELVDYYHFGDGLTDVRKQGMANLLQENHGIRFNKSERNDILLAQFVAGLEYFNLTQSEMADHYMKCA